MSYLAAALGVDRAMRYLSDDSLYSENSNGMRKAVSSFDVFRRASDVSMVVVSTEDVAEAVAAEEKQAAAARAGRERQASVGSNTSRGSNGSAGRVRRRRTVSTRARAGTSGATSAAANKRKSLPLFAMKLFGRKGSSSGEEITMSNLDLDTVNDHGGSSSNETSSTPASPNGDLYASSGNLSSTKSAPATPIGDRLQASASGSAATSTTVRRRPLGAPTVAPSSSTPSLVPLPSPATSKARHKKFHRHFDSVSPDERVLNYYSCALISDILLQGHLYITSNYFAFYSNVFGYVTKVLIPTASVLKVSKEKTARIIPNAVGVATSDEKHVFGSLLSRDNTYKLMVQVWKTALGPPAHSPQPLRAVCAPCRPRAKDLKDEVDSASASGDVLQEDDDSSLSGDAALPPVPLDKIPVVAATKASAVAASTSSALAIASSAHPAGVGLSAGPSLVSQADLNRSSRQTIILGVSTALVAFLLMSTAFLFHRMSRIQDQFRIQTGDNLYQDLARWQNHLHARSAGQVEEFLSTHLDQLAKVRKSLEALTLLIVSNEDDRTQQADVVVHHHSPYRDEKQQTRPPSLAQEEVKNS